MVFEGGLDLTRVRVIERSEFPNWIGRIGAWLRGKPAPAANAITVRNISYFPRSLTGDSIDMDWLMHELTHQWQYQHFGIVYLVQAIFAPTYVYAPPGKTVEEALTEFSQAGKKFADFNREQQGDIVRDFYHRLKAGQDVSAWEPYMQEVRTPPTR